MKTTDEIHDLIQNCDRCGQGGTMNVLVILEHLNNKLSEMEARLRKAEENASVAERAAARANHIAGCLANGIQPD